MRSLVTIAFFCLGLSAGHLSADGPRVTLVSPPTSGAAPFLSFSGVSEPMMVEGSEDLITWSPLFVAGSNFNGWKVTAPVRPGTDIRSFFRLSPLKAPLKLKANPVPGSPHLGTITNYEDVEIGLYGTRDDEGFPAAITRIEYRIGDGTVVATLPETLNEPDADLAFSTAAPQPTSFMKGVVYVQRVGGCPLPGAAPTLLFSAVDYGDESGGTLKGRVLCSRDTVQDIEGYEAFTYSVPVSFNKRLNVETDMERLDRSLEAAFRAGLTLDDPTELELIGDAAEIFEAFGAFRSRTLGGRVLALTSPTSRFMAGIAAGIAGQTAWSQTSPFNPEADGFGAAEHAVIRAVFLSGDDSYRYASEEVTFRFPGFDPTPDLFIEATCGNRVELVLDHPNRSHIRNRSQVVANSYAPPRKAVDDLEFLTSLPAEKTSTLELTDPFAYASGKISVVATHQAITFSATNNLVTTGQDGFSDSDSTVMFKVSPGEGLPAGGLVWAEMDAQTDGSDLHCHIGRSGDTVFQFRNSATHRVWLQVGQVYSLMFYNRMNQSQSVWGGPTVKSRLRFSLLGHPVVQ